MREHEVMSPPFVTELCTSTRIHRQLRLLDHWVDAHREWANEEARLLDAPNDPFVPVTKPVPSNPSVLANVAIPSLFRTWTTLRSIRERWDWIVRNYEEQWDCEKCIFSRVMCVKMGALVLLDAFLDPETHEAKQHEERKNKQEEVVETLKQIGLPDEVLKKMGIISEGDEEGIDFDKLFHSDED